MSELQQKGLQRLCREADPERMEGLVSRLLKDGGNINVWMGSSYIGQILYYADRHDWPHASGDPVKCLQVLKDKGADFNAKDGGGYSPLDYVAAVPYDCDWWAYEGSKSLFDAAKFVLINGGKCAKRREFVIRKLAFDAGMTREQFEGFEKIGQGDTSVKVSDEMNMQASKALKQEFFERQNRRAVIFKAKEEIANLEKVLAYKKKFVADELKSLRKGNGIRHLEAWHKKIIRGRKHIDYQNV